MNKKIPIEVSARHIHLSQDDLEALFGKGYQLKKLKQLTQPCDFAAEEKLDIRIGDKKISGLRIVGPVREQTQVELSTTDSFSLGMEIPLRLSGDITGTPGAFLVGPQHEIEIKEGLIVAKRHLHLTSDEANTLGFKSGESVSIKTEGERAVIFHNVVIRVREDYALCFHLDTDEGNACGVLKKSYGFLIF